MALVQAPFPGGGTNKTLGIRVEGNWLKGVAFIIPNGVTWADADLRVEVSMDDNNSNSYWPQPEIVQPGEDTWIPIYHDGALLVLTGIDTDGPGLYTFDFKNWAIQGFPFIRFVSVSTSDPTVEVNQVAMATVANFLQ